MEAINAGTQIILMPLSGKDADALYALYSWSAVIAHFNEETLLPGESAHDFTNRLLSVCELIFTIRLQEDKDRIIGDCALHHWDPARQEIEIGGSLFPEYWGKGFMSAAFKLLAIIAKERFGVTTLNARTGLNNHQAIQLALKMGFLKTTVINGDILLRKDI